MVFIVLSIPVMMAIGVLVDYGRASSAHGKLQSAMDAAVLAGAHDGSSGWTGVALTALKANLNAKEPTLAGSTFALTAAGTYDGVATATISTTMSKLFGIDSLTVAAHSTAVVKSGESVCILLMKANASPGLLMNGGAKIDAPSCQVHIKATGNPAATFNASSTINSKKTCLAGLNVLDNGGSHPNLSKGCTTVADPFAGTLPVPASATCTYSNQNYNGASVTLSPGVYCGWTNFNGGPAVTLSPGVYVIKNGGFNVNGGSFTGTGVTFFFADSSYIQTNGTVALNLAAPTSGTYANLLIYETQGLAESSFTMNATAGATLQGLIWLPSRNLTLNAGANVTSDKLTMVLDTLIVNTANWTLTSSDKAIPAAGGGGGIYLVK